ncbi:hypothetical protein LTR36_003605 [Oleoguttula mirabilis]|uniref:Uncharacterized protein n=1 Tax=Oleoguttula mirabilis TaxID=1507867 RepID=A0AAV9JJG8_9PEZI|nr:hypothetical protein LTR36_003605 [Oleoguttula mirabilis]
MTVPEFALCYEACSIAELRSFIRARTGEDLTDYDRDDSYADRTAQADEDASYLLFDLAEKKEPYVAALRRADRLATFRFFDLAPELRNHIYDELLLLKREYCWPSILATSRRAFEEGEGILYNDDVITVSMCDTSPDVTVGHQELSHSFVDIFYCDIGWPAHLLRMKRLRLACTLTRPKSFSFDSEQRFLRIPGTLMHQRYWRSSQINCILWHLHYFLLGACNVQELQIHLESTHEDTEDLQSILSPARLLAPVNSLTTGGLDCETAKSLQHAMSPVALGFPP